MNENSAVKTRNEIDDKYKWHLDHIFPSDEAWEEAYSECEKAIAAFAELDGKVCEEPEWAIRKFFELYAQVMPVAEYAMLGKESDNGSPKMQAMLDRTDSLLVKFATSTSFLEPELLELSPEKLIGIENDSSMSDYSEFVRSLIRQKEHTLPKEQEKIIAMASEVTGAPNQIFGMLSSVDMKFPPVTMPDGSQQPLTESTYSSFIHSSSRSVRKQAFEGIMGTYGQFGNTIAATYSASVKADNFNASVHNYPSARAAAMDPLEIPESVYDNLIDVVHEYIPVLQDYLNLRKQVLLNDSNDELHMYDLYCPMVSDYSMDLPYEKAFDLVLEGLAPMGEDYVAKLREARDGGWIDVFPSQGKSSGAFSSGSLTTVHPFVLLNHNDNLDSAFTIAHELGHAMHSYYSNTSQPLPKTDYSLFVAEVASTCNEAVMQKYLLKKFPDKKGRAYLLNHSLEQFRTTCIRQTMFAEFEKITHDMASTGQPLTKQTFSDVYYNLNKTYYGGACLVDDVIRNEWMRIPHFYRGFYVYVYATGFCAATYLSERILTEGENAVRDYRKFLKAGCSVPPIDALKLAGIDMSSPEPIRCAMEVFKSTLEEFKELIL